MNQANQVNPTSEIASPQESLSPETLNTLFAQLNPDDIERFHKSYQAWTLQHQRVALLTQIAILQQKIMENAERMQRLAPSALALASLTQLRACGVEDVDPLERMLERGEVWLDHTIQLLVRCEQLDVIGSSYTEWCEHALEGAYDWIGSIGEDSDETSATPADIEPGSPDTTVQAAVQITEELILQKLMSDDEEAEETEKVSAVHVSAVTQPLSTQDVLSSDDESIEIQDPTQELKDTPIADVELQLSAEATYEVYEIEEIGQEEQVEPVEASTESTDTQINLIEELIAIPPSELLPDLVTDDQLGSSSLETEGIETSSSMQANQPPTELSLDTQPTESASVDHLQAEEAGIKSGDAVDQVEELQADVSISDEIEQVNLAEGPEQESAEEAYFEIVDTTDYLEVLQADILIGDEIEQASLEEGSEQELVEEAGIESGDGIDQVEELQADISISDEIEQASLAEGPEQESAEEVGFEAGGEIDQAEVLQASAPSSNEIEQASLAEQSQQIGRQELTKDPEPSLVHHEQRPVVNQETHKVEEEKPQQKALPSKRGFLRGLLAKIGHR